MHAVRERQLLFEACGIHADDLRLAYVIGEEERSAARDAVTRLAAGRRPLIGLQIQSFATKAHRDWPIDSFVSFARRELQRWPQAHFLVFGDKATARAAQPLSQALGPRVSVVAGTVDIRRSAAMLEQLDLYLGVDTGPTHLAGALGIPMVALYHWAYPGSRLAPLDHPGCRVIEHPATGQHDPVHAGMDAISVDSVCSAADELLALRHS
jgi:ADP-heptose:LPS heptosyltransferase